MQQANRYRRPARAPRSHLYIQVQAPGAKESRVRRVFQLAQGSEKASHQLSIHGYGYNRVFFFEWDALRQPYGRDQSQIYWQKQPGTLVDYAEVIWNDGNGHRYTLACTLAEDRVITLAPDRGHFPSGAARMKSFSVSRPRRGSTSGS